MQKERFKFFRSSFVFLWVTLNFVVVSLFLRFNQTRLFGEVSPRLPRLTARGRWRWNLNPGRDLSP